MPSVRFNDLVISPTYGDCPAGSILKNCSEAFARHVVDELGKAEYLQPSAIPAAADAEPEVDATPALSRRARRRA